jgi:hypothetical protein
VPTARSSKCLNGSHNCHDVIQPRRDAEEMDLPPDTFGLVAAPDDRPQAAPRR